MHAFVAVTVPAIDTQLPPVQVPPQQSAPCWQAAPAAWHVALPWQVPPVHCAEQQLAPVVHAALFAVQAVVAATQLPDSQRFEQQLPESVHAVPSATHAPVAPPSPTIVPVVTGLAASRPASGDGIAALVDELPQCAAKSARNGIGKR